MKVKIRKEDRRFLQEHIAEHMIDIMAQEDSSKPSEVAEMAIREIMKGTNDWLPVWKPILKAEARVALNCRIQDLYFEGSEDYDVWVEATARTAYGFIEIGAYLSDIWQVGALEEGELRRRAWVQYFRESRL